jgi:hypothetical protein
VVRLYAMTRPRLLLTVVGAAAFAALLALAAFLPTAYAEKISTPAKTTDTTASDENSPVTSENHSWKGYHWARTTTNPFTLKLGDNLSTAWNSVLATTSSDWSQSSVLDTNIVEGSNNKKCRPTSGQVEVCSAAYGRKGWLGIASVWVSGHHITQGTIKLNDTYFKTSKYNKPEWRNLVSCQEVGHTLGLETTRTKNSAIRTSGRAWITPENRLAHPTTSTQTSMTTKS